MGIKQVKDGCWSFGDGEQGCYPWAVEGGDCGEAIGTPDILSSFTGMLYALTSGNYKHGTFTLATPLTTAETLIFSTGLTNITGVLIAINGFPIVNNGNPAYQRTGVFIYFPNFSYIGGGGKEYNRLLWFDSVENVGVRVNDTSDIIANGGVRIENGDFYVTAKYNNNDNYTPFWAGKTYTWVAW